jgi:hypothetical protein
MVEHVAPLMHLAALNRRRIAGILLVALLSNRLLRRCSPGKLWGLASSQYSTEATCFALLALRAIFDKGILADEIHALTNYRRSDGFWPAVDRDTAAGVWATAFAVNT